MNEQIIEAITQNVIGIIGWTKTNYILLTGNDDDIVMPVALAVAQSTRLPITPRRSEDELAVAPGYFVYPGLTLLPRMDDLDEREHDDVLDLVTSITENRCAQPTYEKFHKTNVVIIVIDSEHSFVTSLPIPDFSNVKLR